jgi:hypothetical protein
VRAEDRNGLGLISYCLCFIGCKTQIGLVALLLMLIHCLVNIHIGFLPLDFKKKIKSIRKSPVVYFSFSILFPLFNPSKKQLCDDNYKGNAIYRLFMTAYNWDDVTVKSDH